MKVLLQGSVENGLRLDKIIAIIKRNSFLEHIVYKIKRRIEIGELYCFSRSSRQCAQLLR